VVDNGLYISSPVQLPLGKGGDFYQHQLQALGGTPPYFWGLSEGELPPGLSLQADGTIQGTLEASGSYAFSAKVFDNGTPPSVADKSFNLPVSVAPLDVIGGTELDVLVAKLIVLPLILIIPDFPVPYSATLEATGGQAPLLWEEEPLADGLADLIPNSGIPEGLTLGEDGSLTGTLVDPSQAVGWTVPVLNITLYGFFFSARVTDDQVIPYEDSAFYLIPTVPLDF
jgi:hypothetical protein